MGIYLIATCVCLLAAWFLYLQLVKCEKLRKRLMILGTSKGKLKGLKAHLSSSYLKDLLYEKETELSEESYLMMEKGEDSF